MSKKIEQLKAALRVAEAERDAAATRYDEAVTALYEAEREAARNQKPTPAMLALLRELNNGATLQRQKYYPYRMVLMRDSVFVRNVPASVVDGLHSREALKRIGYDPTRQEFEISEHGETFIESSSPVDTQVVSV